MGGWAAVSVTNEQPRRIGPFHEIVAAGVTLHWQGHVRLGSSRVNATPASTAAVPISFAEVVGSPRTSDATTIATMGTTFE